MKFQNQVVCTGIKESKGDYEGRPFSSTTFHLIVDIAENTSGRSMGVVTRPFKFGDASEYEKWQVFAKAWPEGGVRCVADFDIVAGAGNESKLTLLGIRPAPQAK